jgi:hypothetical protein
MTIEQLKTEAATILNLVATEKRSMTAAEDSRLGVIKTEIAALETAIAADKANVETQKRSVIASQLTKNPADMDSNTYFRSLTRGGSEVGPQAFVQEVVKVFETESPIWRNHGNIKTQTTGNAFNLYVLTPGGAGYKKTEGNAGTADTSSSLVLQPFPFSTYSSQAVTVSQEMLDDLAYDISGDITSLGMSKSTVAFDADAVAALVSSGTYTGDLTSTSGEVTLAAVTAKFMGLPDRHRLAPGIKYFTNAIGAAKLLALITWEAKAQCDAISLTPENIVIDTNVPARMTIITNVTKAIGIGMKTPVRVFTLEVSAGRQYEIQPRLAVAVRDASAVVGYSYKA